MSLTEFPSNNDPSSGEPDAAADSILALLAEFDRAYAERLARKEQLARDAENAQMTPLQRSLAARLAVLREIDSLFEEDGLQTSFERNPDDVRRRVPLFTLSRLRSTEGKGEGEGRGSLGEDEGGRGSLGEKGEGRGSLGEGEDTIPGKIPRDLGELHERFEVFIKRLIRVYHLHDPEDVYGDIILRMHIRGFVGNYDPRVATIRTSIAAFVIPQLLRHRTARRRREANERSNEDRKLPFEDGVELADYRLMVAQFGSPVLSACAVALEVTGTVTGKEVGRLLGVGERMGRRLLGSLDEDEVRAWLLSEEE